MVLNYGHTIGHAIERVAKLSHGESVSIGMAAAARLSSAILGFSQVERHLALLQRLALPTTCLADLDETLRLLSKDKKRDGSGIRMVLLRDIGEPVLVHVGEAALSSALSDTLR